MKQNGLEFAAGMSYGVFKGFAKILFPPSRAFFKDLDLSIKSVSGTATVGQMAGETIVKIIVPTSFFL